MKKLFCFFAVCLLLSSCAAPVQTVPSLEDDRLQVVATLFAQYDFARQIAGDCATVTLLLPPGVESHSFDPTPADVISIGKADLLFYTGDAMEPWAASLLAGLDAPVRSVDLSTGLALSSPETDPLNLHIFSGGHEGHAHAQNTLSAPDSPAPQDVHDHLYDPHFWTSPVLAMQMSIQIRDALCNADPQNAPTYQKNADLLLSELQKLDDAFRQLVQQAPHKEMVFGSRFAVYYFAREYNLSFLSPYDSCSSETEPAARALAQTIDFAREHKVPVIFYQELSETKVAQTIAEACGARLLLFHSCHNLSKQEWEAGETYLSLMQTNLANLKEGLSS